jgi:hypothetical protein
MGKKSLVVSNCHFDKNYYFRQNHNSFAGNAIYFEGTQISIRDSYFYQDTGVFGSEGQNVRPVETIRLLIDDEQIGTEPSVEIVNNRFQTRKTNVVFYANDISLDIYKPTNVNIIGNIFDTNRVSGQLQPKTRILFESELLSNIRVINNTDVYLVNGAIAQNIQYNFISHNQHLIARNNLFSGLIATTSPSATNSVEHCFNVHVYFNGRYRFYDPQINNTTFAPIWNNTTKSPLINGGHYDTNDNGIFWWDDPEDQSIEGLIPHIGAVNPVRQRVHKHHLNRNLNYYWLAFPFLDKLFDPPGDEFRDARLEHVLAPSAWHNYNYMFFNPQIIESIEWNYNDVFDKIDVSNPTHLYKYEHVINSKYGYKIGVNPNIPVPRPIIISGFRPKTSNNPVGDITIEARKPNQPYNEIWLGYFGINRLCPLSVFAPILDDLIEIKTQNWALNKILINGVETWMGMAYSGLQFVLNYGEAISLKYTGTTNATITWPELDHEDDGGGNDDDIHFYPMPEFFDFEDQADYIPVYVYLPEEMAVEFIGELGLFIDDVCYGAEVILGELVQINAYIIGLDLDDVDVEFRFHEYGSRSTEISMSSYSVFNQTDSSFHAQNLDLSSGEMFYVVSFREEKKEIEPEPWITGLIGNYPNPFNPETTIMFTLSNESNVEINVYNVRGQRVRSLVNDYFEAGHHQVVWNGRDNSDREVSSGIYLYRMMKEGDLIETRRMVLLK